MRPARGLIARAVRVSAYAFVVSVAAGAIAEQKAEARAADAALAFGEQLLDVTKDDGGAHDLVINGHHLYVSSARTKMPFEAVLERFRGQCASGADGMTESFQHLDTLDAPAAPPGGFPGIGLIKDVRDGRGVVMCFAPGERVDHVDLAKRLDRFLRSHDLADVGHLRYAVARALDDGGSMVTASWTDAAFRLDEMFPSAGDALGSDPTFALRPDGSRRLLSARDARAPYGAFVYSVPMPPEQVLRAYAEAAERAGWSANAVVPTRLADTNAFTRGGVDIVVRTIPSAEGTTISILEMPAPGATGAPAPAQKSRGVP